jgi:tRNA dimethylallyltransferase
LRKNLQTRSVEELQNILLALKANMHNKTDLENKERLIRAIEIERARESQSAESLQKPQVKAAVFGIRWERAMLRKRITARLRQRLEEGMLEEVESLHMAGLSWAKLESFGLEYRYIAKYLQGQITYQEMFEQLNTRIHQFAKRQDTWFRRMERKGIAIDWISGNDYILLKEKVIKYLND